MKVLSLFDGISCGRVALDRAGIPVERYVSYEIEQSAIDISKFNWPEIEQRGDVFKADFTEYKGFDLLIGGSPCFTKGHLVLTDHGYVPIEDIHVGDLVYTHKNRFKPVTAIGHKWSVDVYQVHSQGTEDFYVTGNHPFFVSYMHRERDPELRKQVRIFDSPTWKTIDQLEKGDFMASPILTSNSNPLHLTEEDCFIIGRYIADGHIRCDKRKGRKNSYHYAVVLSIGTKKVKDFLSHVKSYHVTHYSHSQSVERCLLCSKDWVERILSLKLGTSCYEKNIPTELLMLPIPLCKALLDGYLSGDGCQDNYWHQQHACTVSKRLAYSIGLLVQKVYGVNCSVRAIASRGNVGTIAGRQVTLHQQWEIQFKTEMQKQSVATVIDDVVYTPFKYRKKAPDAVVYNISVADDESYICNNRIVHNCTYWSISQKPGRREKTCEGLGWELFSQYIRAWKESGVKYYLYENNASMSKDIRAAITEAFGHEPLEINSALVSAQTRKRLYWTNIPGACVPEDRGITQSDIVESGFVDRPKSLCAARRNAGYWGTMSYLCRRYWGKSFGQPVFEGDPTKLADLRALYDANPRFTDDEARATGCTIRPMTVTEYERLQTLPDGYTSKACKSRTLCVEAIGNGWTVDVIAHLISGLANAEKEETIKFPEITPEPGFVLSEYKLDTVGNLTDEDFARLPRKCTVCGKDLNHEHIISAVDVKDKLHPICMECEMDLKEEAKLREMRAMAGVSTDKELIDWIIKISMLRKVLDVNSGT